MIESEIVIYYYNPCSRFGTGARDHKEVKQNEQIRISCYC